MTTGRVFGVLPTFRRQELLVDTIRQVAAQTRTPDVVIVVDNESSDETRAIVTGPGSELPQLTIRYLRAPDNPGSAGGWEFGMNAVFE